MLTESSRGFSIVELLIAVTIAALLLGLGVPAMGTFLQNAKINSVSQSLQASLALARTEAIRRNVPVEFVLTNSDVGASDVANSVASAPAGRNWIVRAPLPAPSTAFELLDAKSGNEGEAQSATPSVVMTVTAATTVFGGSIVFNGFGGTLDVYNFDLSNPAGGACTSSGGPMQCRRIRVSTGGQTRSCDPTIAVTFDTRYCGTP